MAMLDVISSLSKHLPRLHCTEIVELNDSTQYEHIAVLYENLKSAQIQKRFGLPQVCQNLFDFSCQLRQPEVARLKEAKEYAILLSEGLPFYPLQVDLLIAGIIALLEVFKMSHDRTPLVEVYMNCFTSLLAIDVPKLRNQIIASLNVVLRSAKTRPPLSTDVVDLLLELLKPSSFDSDVVPQSLSILAVDVIGHRKAEQYTSFIQCLQNHGDNEAVVIQACRSVISFASRAEVEAHRTAERMKSPRTSPPCSGTLSHWLTTKPVGWMCQDGSDVRALVHASRFHDSNPNVARMISLAMVSLIKCSQLHAKAVSDLAWETIFKMIQDHLVPVDKVFRTEDLEMMQEIAKETHNVCLHLQVEQLKSLFTITEEAQDSSK